MRGMSIAIIEDNITFAKNDNYKSIISLIINAVVDYPLFGINDVGAYLKDLTEKLDIDNINERTVITDKIITDHILNDDKAIWYHESINSLNEALGLMRLYHISFNDIILEIERLKSI